MGMDTEIVAAALDEAHKDILDNLPADAKASPIGWRYMDKFVQLPFFIPPTTSEQMVAYTDALLSERAVTNDPEVQEAATLLRDPSLTDIVGEATKISLEKDFNTSQSLQLTQIARSQEREKLGSTIRKQIQDFDEEEDIVKKEIRGAAGEIDNPRQMKRFINMFRLLSFHKIAQDTSKGIQLDANQPPTLNQIKRWIILSLKWPEVARWIRREGSCKEIGRSTRVKNLDLNQISTIKLLHLEEISKRYDKGEKIRTRKAWEKKIKDRLHLDLVQCPWIDNPELMKFFEDERDKEKMERLSAAAGKGLW